MSIIKRMPTKAFVFFESGANGLGHFFKLWQSINADGPLCPLPKADNTQMSRDLERMRRQQVHVDEIKRLCHVPVIE